MFIEAGQLTLVPNCPGITESALAPRRKKFSVNKISCRDI